MMYDYQIHGIHIQVLFTTLYYYGIMYIKFHGIFFLFD